MKSIFASKTFWFNVVTALLAVIAVFSPEQLQGLGLGANAVETTLKVLGTISMVGNIVLRFLTDKPVTVTGK